MKESSDYIYDSAYGALILKKAVSYGNCALFKLAMNLKGIDCVRITGNAWTGI